MQLQSILVVSRFIVLTAPMLTPCMMSTVCMMLTVCTRTGQIVMARPDVNELVIVLIVLLLLPLPLVVAVVVRVDVVVVGIRHGHLAHRHPLGIVLGARVIGPRVHSSASQLDRAKGVLLTCVQLWARGWVEEKGLLAEVESERGGAVDPDDREDGAMPEQSGHSIEQAAISCVKEKRRGGWMSEDATAHRAARSESKSA
mmetsp:Transcript_21098/g.50058  ORF Transcript_21098/g.50058 Transcript_21098/m.50058 type:complete len:200 (-) Transcript_21098:801-1400(-)